MQAYKLSKSTAQQFTLQAQASDSAIAHGICPVTLLKCAASCILALLVVSLWPAKANAAEALSVDILYVEQRLVRPPVLSNLITWPEDDGLQGASLGVSDNNTTGKFLNQEYTLEAMVFEPGENPASVMSAVRDKLASGPRLVILNLPAELLLQLADSPEAQDDLFFNAQSTDNVLRQQQCKANVLHTMASRAMLSDALIQFFNRRKWKQVFLVEGNRAADKAFAQSIRRSITKFGLDIVQDKTWLEDADMRRTASSEVPVFTQARKYDAVIVTDEDRDFSQYILYNTWLPRPVAGSAGLTPVVWSPVIEQWGAAQLQSRFRKLSDREMSSRDYANWAAVRTIGEAVTRTNQKDPAAIRDYVLSDNFELAGFKGSSLSFRQWNGQLRQPIQLVHANAVVASAPIEGFLHPVTELDTLGSDRPETNCISFND